MSTFGIIVGNRGFFPDHLARSGREQIIAALTAAGHDVVCPTPHQTKHGAVESRAHAKIVADLFRQNRDRIEGIIITLPNFGEERAMADALRLADLNVPVLIHAFPDNPDRMLIADRRDSFCGKMSICNNLKQYRIPYSLTTLHTEGLDTDEFKNDIAWFAGVCRVTNGLRKLRIGAIGARPAAFNTVRYSEKLLEMSGITVEPLDLSEVFGRIAKLASTDAKVQAQVEAIRAYVSTDKAVCFHCSNLPKHFFREVKMDYQAIIAGSVGKLNTFGTCVGRVKATPMSFARFSTDDAAGKIRGYVGGGRFTDDPLETFGGAGVVEIPRLQQLLRYICENGFEHHVAANLSATADAAVYEAAKNYLGWDMYWHR